MISQVPFRRLAPLALLLLAVPSSGRAAAGRWTAVGPFGGSVLAIAPAPSAPRIVYAGTVEGVFKSTDAGGRWSHVGHGLPNGTVRTLAVHPRNPAVVYAGFSDRHPLFKTTDGGRTWRSASEGLDSENVIGLAIDPRNPSVLFAATQGGLFQSDDGAATWRPNPAFPRDPGGVNTHDLAVPPSPSRVVYAAMEYRGVLKSGNHGGTWRDSSQGILGSYLIHLAAAPSLEGLPVTQWFLVIDPQRPNRLYAATGIGIYRLDLE